MLLYDNVSENDVWKYWKTLFPEVKKEEELKNMLNVCEPFDDQKINLFWNRHKVEQAGFMKWLDNQDDVLPFSTEWNHFVEDNHMNHMFYPLFLYQKKRVNGFERKIQQCELFSNPKEVCRTLLEEICLRLREISVRTFITEINVESAEKRLSGESKEERYLDYTNHRWRTKSYIQKFYKEYQALLDMQMVVLELSMDSILETIDRIQDDYEMIMDRFFQGETDILIHKLECGLGDSHRGGRSVASILFSNGKKLIYKPRNLGTEVGFSKYSKAINEGMKLEEASLYETQILERNGYGYIEFIEQRECTDETQVERYYYRSGIIMAMLYSLNAKDIHHENLIACGEYPVMIDLEALFHSRLEHENLFHEKTAYEKAMESIDDSVYSIGLLPMQLMNPYDKENASVDISGFGGEEQQISPFKVLMIQNRNTDEIRLEKSNYMIEPQKNVVRIHGKIANSGEYRDVILKGFEDAYVYIMKQAGQLIIDLAEWFGNVTTRIIYRPTYLYTKLMFTSTHPDFMREKVHKYVLFHRMAYKVKEQEKGIVASEIKDMMRGDVPFFEIDIHSGKMRNSLGNIFPLNFKKTPFQLVKEKIQNFSEDDLGYQKMIIEHAFLSKKTEDYRNIWLTKTEWVNQSGGTLPYVEMAEEIGLRLLKEAKVAFVNGKKELSWINYTPVGDNQINYEFGPLEGDLYSGTSGIGLFFLYLWKMTQKNEYKEAAYACIHEVIQRMKNIKEDSYYLVGPFNGLSGYIYVFSKFYLVTKDEEMLALVKDGLNRMKAIYHRDTNYDVISGCAGAIKVCFSLMKNFDGEVKKQSEEMIKLLAEHLVHNQKEIESGEAAWYSGLKDHVYSGYAHGSAGIEEALTFVNEIYPMKEIEDSLYKSHRFVQKMYDKKNHNWKTVYGRNDYSYAWCHGSPGILFSQAKQLQSIKETDCAFREKEILVENLKDMMKHALGNNICYCHGDIGNLELIRRIAIMIDDKELGKTCECTFRALALKIPSYIEERPLLPYGFMLGLSGIGYALLAACSKEVPFVLDLE